MANILANKWTILILLQRQDKVYNYERETEVLFRGRSLSSMCEVQGTKLWKKYKRNKRREEERKAIRWYQGNGEVICQLFQSLFGYDLFFN